ncbi:hypothetical protein HDV02_004451 [Globomyces sp. JEL0801]|nr:hypothetical protein HDV02_004451 [Globomyces sp. JEL0801]
MTCNEMQRMFVMVYMLNQFFLRCQGHLNGPGFDEIVHLLKIKGLINSEEVMMLSNLVHHKVSSPHPIYLVHFQDEPYEIIAQQIRSWIKHCYNQRIFPLSFKVDFNLNPNLVRKDDVNANPTMESFCIFDLQ